MRDYEEVKVVNTDYIEKSVTCNKCGKTLQLEGEDYEREWQANVFKSFVVHFGYGSKYDMERWSFDLCEDCLSELVRTFKHLPEGFEEEESE